jgi:alkylhydroperoxidase/carboxymuconolactone decarboxylase family protein YurZ
MRRCSRPTGHRRADDDDLRYETTRAALAVLSLALLASACAHASPGRGVSGSGAPSVASSTETVGPRSEGGPPMILLNEVRRVAPALERYTQGRLLGEVWKRPGLVPRDRSIVTLAALIARNQTIEMPYYVNLALDNGVMPREISEIITHLAFYSGWANAMSAVAVAKNVFLSARSAPISSRRLHRRFFPSMRSPRRNAPPASESSSARWRQELCSTRPMCCSATCGCVRTLRPATGVS